MGEGLDVACTVATLRVGPRQILNRYLQPPKLHQLDLEMKTNI